MSGRASRFVVVLAVLTAVPPFVLAQAPARTSAPAPSPAEAAEAKLVASMHSISSNTLFDWVKEMCEPKYKGRLTGTPEYDAIADWSARLLASWTVKPAGDAGTYLQKFPDPYTLVLPGAELSIELPGPGGAPTRKSYVVESDYFPGSTSDSGTATAEVIYVGYGITAPELGYDDYAGVDVKGKLVMMEPEVPVWPPDKEPELFRKWRPYSFHDYKAKNAASHGAVGMVYNYHIANPNCVFIKGFLLSYVGAPVWNDVFAGTGKTHDQVVKAIQTTREPASFATGKVMTIKNVTEHHPEGIGSNVVGWIDGSDPRLKEEAIVVGGHLDHLGLNPDLMPGAHDNASGAAITLAVAQALATSGIPLKRSVVFILFGAEEQGVKGSEYYVAHPFIPNGRTRGFINMESVGRGERLSAGGGRNYPELFEPFERLNAKYVHRPLTAGRTSNIARPRQDAAHFMWADVPTLSFGVGGAPPLPYATYHTTKDAPGLITPEIMEDLARLTFLAVVDLANRQ